MTAIREARNRKAAGELASAMVPLDIRACTIRSDDGQMLMHELDAVIGERYPGLPVNGLEPAFEAEGGFFVIAYADGAPVAIGALRAEGDAAEVKRMYVRAAHRRRGIAWAVLDRLEAEAKRRGFRRMILETGIHQPEAIALYETAGWTRIPPYGIYVDEPVSVCFGKELG